MHMFELIEDTARLEDKEGNSVIVEPAQFEPQDRFEYVETTNRQENGFGENLNEQDSCQGGIMRGFSSNVHIVVLDDTAGPAGLTVAGAGLGGDGSTKEDRMEETEATHNSKEDMDQEDGSQGHGKRKEGTVSSSNQSGRDKAIVSFIEYI